MSLVFLGVDTSNYTTSLALYDTGDNSIRQARRLLPVLPGSLGLRQSDALFQHVKALPELLAQLLGGLTLRDVSAIGVSVRPRDVEGSYMPCFLAGASFAGSMGEALGVPVFDFSHQAGHLAAGLWSASRMPLFDRRLLALHVSGGTTELLLAEPSACAGFDIEKIGGSTDLTAGQLIDRAGVMLGLPFPAGPALEKLSDRAEEEKPFAVRVRDGAFSLSGLQNKAETMWAKGASDNQVARFVFDSVGQALSLAAQQARERHPDVPLLCVGGVIENKRIRQCLQPLGAVCAAAGCSSDNAVGPAVLAARRYGGHT